MWSLKDNTKAHKRHLVYHVHCTPIWFCALACYLILVVELWYWTYLMILFDFCIQIYVLHKRKLLHIIDFEKASLFPMSVYFSRVSNNLFAITEILLRIWSQNFWFFTSFPVHFSEIFLKIAKESLNKNLAHYSSGA